ncbi:MAG: 30S ribosomal protein S8 [Candidatus Micrarchaeota archaeon]|nr:30S ribosomal protein S8 [Candidatus Micrarchaeota archaeon]
MPADLLSESLNKIKIYENLGRPECVVASTRLVRNVLLTLKQNGYVSEIEEVKDGKLATLRVSLANKINNIGAVKPRHAVKVNDYTRYENRYIPSKDFGLLIMSTPAGIMSNRDAKEKRMGGRLLAYVY